MSPLYRALPALLLSSLLACEPSGPEDCSRYGVTLSPVPATARHLTCASTACGDGLNPPTSGDHCSDTLRCRVYDAEQNRCVWLHNLEHGHVVFLYNCPEGCPELVATLDSFRQEAKVGSNGVIRAIVAPDSRIPTRVAALMWRRSWGADAPDADAIRCMMQHQDAEAPEPELACLP
ncbi:DUF3105 domain-containing protein [Archangium lansingense]|uniref:DUF3105 domain-containing protein n=1 Tax=Archangium lansingense TaxID=2995310 RepID=A0ABT4AA28_9BACT|nr:DUF3105 domain-containing protein [Archangium lansinium]MCY1078518.1 DUF3105 domain-containing protein [Archangium lansinium]